MSGKRSIRIGTVVIGRGNPIAVQSMAASKTTDIDATVETVNRLEQAGAAIVRLAVDTERDVRALPEIRRQTHVSLSIDLQENYRLAEKAAPYIDKIRYNPGHLHHAEPNTPWREKVRRLAEIAKDHDLAIRVGINCGSIDPVHLKAYKAARAAAKKGNVPDPFAPILESALEHTAWLDEIGFTRYCVSIKDSNPETVILVNRRFADLRPEVPIHLGVTEAGLPAYGIPKSRYALETLLSEGIGDTLRVSLTVPNNHKQEEVEAGRMILANVAAGRMMKESEFSLPKLNIVSCPSCARVQNSAFVALAEEVQKATEFAADVPLKIAVMGCRVNGPGETDDADFGLWCGADKVNFKEGEKLIGSYPYGEIVPVLVLKLKERIKSA
ncbi:MAG: flavodoxin-dependent (E)-4-hydroxy-3-methylbut-2-enyl-diphosphate synthase [Thermoguttaceae bacterium]|nr:flavodoxin-dependent (E)-4-hydroxy-3-methylbut-2-enyl-diphosphate synthase [Thermoguttaceae bacterium]